MPNPLFDVRYLKPDGTWEPLNVTLVELSPVAYIRHDDIDWAAPQGEMSVSMNCDVLPGGDSRVRKTCPLPLNRSEMKQLARRARAFRPQRRRQLHTCSAITAWLRGTFPRLTTAQIARLARTIRRKRGRPITSMRDLVKRLSRKELVQMGNRMWRGAP